MNPNNQHMFDELVRQKLEGYSEPPDMELLQTIHARKSRILKWYGLYRILIITTSIGLATLGLYFGIVLTHPESAVGPQHIIHPGFAASSESAAQINLPSPDNHILVEAALNEPLQPATYPHAISVKQHREIVRQAKPQHPVESNVRKTHQAEPIEGMRTENPKNIATNRVQVDPDKKGENDLNTCEIAFDYFVSYSGEFQFTNFSAYGKTVQYQWEFGDGSHSGLVSPAHAYKIPGTYQVRLTMKSEGCAQTLSKTVHVGGIKPATVPSSIKGIVRAGNEAVENAVVELIPTDRQDEENRILVTRTNKKGEFFVSHLQAGRYLLAAHPDGSLPQYLKTYWGNESQLELAPEIVITNADDETLTGYSIDLIYQAPVYAWQTPQPIGTESGSQVILFDQNNQIVGYGTVNENGEIIYNGNLNGTFKVMDKATGAVKGVVQLGNGPSQHVSKGILEAPSQPTARNITLNPNPASSFVNVNVNNTEGDIASVLVMDANGKEMLRTAAGNGLLNKIPVDISELPAGVYYVVVMMRDGTMASTRLLKSDGVRPGDDR